MDHLINLLNPQQKQAVLAVTGPIRIIAGAGSGKTRVITTKIAYLIQNLGLIPSKICALTFTNKAANEMKQRLIKMIGEDGYQSWIMTYHGLCLRILREDIKYIRPEYPNSFPILDTSDQLHLLKKICKSVDGSFDTSKIRNVKALIENWQNNNYKWTEAQQDFANSKWYEIYAEIYKQYELEKLNLKVIDFNDLLSLVNDLFDNNPDIAKKWRQRFDYLLVDEFQDTNEMQYNLIKHLVKDVNNITVVGDPDQTIYTWRGAKVEIILNFNIEFPNCQTILLTENYRSTQNILNLANYAIQQNSLRIQKNLVTHNELGALPCIYESGSGNAEAQWVADEIKRLVKSETCKYNDILILYRNNYLSRSIELAMTENKIPYQVIGSFRFYDRQEIKDVLALLRVILWEDEISILRCLRNTPRIGDKSVSTLIEISEHNQISMLELMLKRSELLPLALTNNLKPLINTITWGQQALSKVVNLGEYVQELISLSKIDEQWTTVLDNNRLENIAELINSINTFAENNTQLTGIALLDEFLQSASLYSVTDDIEEEHNQIKIMTIHMAKGLEYKTVFIVGLNDGILPSLRVNDDINEDNKLEEERRLFYVAMTRAKRYLYLTYPHGFSVVLKEALLPSRFVSNLPIELYEKKVDRDLVGSEINSSAKTTIPNLQINPSFTKQSVKQNLWKINDQVNHPIFGTGVVIKMFGVNLQIQFPDPYGIRVLRYDAEMITRIKQ